MYALTRTSSNNHHRSNSRRRQKTHPDRFHCTRTVKTVHSGSSSSGKAEGIVLVLHPFYSLILLSTNTYASPIDFSIRQGDSIHRCPRHLSVVHPCSSEVDLIEVGVVEHRVGEKRIRQIGAL
jgi:hypothetical protein